MAPLLHLKGSLSEHAPRASPSLVTFFVGQQHLFHEPMFRTNDDWAKSGEMSVVDATVVDGHAKKTGNSEGFAARLDFFQVTPERFFAGIDAEHGLKDGDISF
jgi:hypothetical protein